MSTEELQALLAASSKEPGVFIDVHRHTEGDSLDEKEVQKQDVGSGFCVVDADDSEDGGFGVVGLTESSGTKDGKDKQRSPSQESQNNGEQCSPAGM